MGWKGSRRPSLVRLQRAWLAWLALCLLGCCTGLHATDQPLQYRIGAGTLDEVLRAFAQQSGTQLLYPPERTAHRNSKGLRGRYSPSQALDALLRESGLRAEAVAPDTYVLRRVQAAAPRRTRPVPRAPAAARPTQLATVEVTGTHLRQTALETAAPLTVISHAQIEHSGYQTLFELLRAQPGVRVSNTPIAMADGTAYQYNGLSGAIGAAAVDLRGLGPTATLFLVDGQRMAGYGLAQGEFGQVNDLDSIPLALIERIEVLRDGASAIYGSDAMAGVVNIILRKQFDGVALDGNVGISSRGDAQQHRGTATFGTTTGDGGHLMLSLDYLQRMPLLGRQRAWVAAAAGAPPKPGDAGGDFFFDNGQISHGGGQACSQFLPDGPCNAGAASQTSLQAGLESRSLLAHVDHPLGPFTLYLGFRWTTLQKRQQMAPATQQLLIGDPSQPDGYRSLTYAFNDIGPVHDVTRSSNDQLSLGLRGSSGGWDWNLRLDDQRNASTDRVHGLLRTSVLEQALNDGSYQLGSMDNRPGLLAQLAPVLRRTGHTSQTGFSAHIDGALGSWPSGAPSLAAGIEGYREQLVDHPDPLLLQNDVFQFQSPYTHRGNRWISAAYLELQLPLARRLSANLAGRIDHSSGFGWAASPRLALKWDITDSISLRGTLARGYRAPTLPELNRPPSLTPGGVMVEVPNTLLPCSDPTPSTSTTTFCTLRLDSVGNRALRPERSRSITLGLVLAPTPALGIALDVFQIRRSQEINPLPVSYALDHPQSYPQLFQRDAAGVLNAFDQQLVNLGHTSVRSYDLDAHYRLQTDHFGRFDLHLGMDWLAELRRQTRPGATLESFAGYANQPRATALAGLQWAAGNWTSNANLRFTGHYAFAPSSHSQITCPAAQQQSDQCTTPAFALLDLDLEYAGIRHWRFALNVHNALDHRPAYYGNPIVGYNPAFDDVVGRYFLLSFRYRSQPRG
ncbi:MAG: TonB-dependent receptor [Pseudomonadota bacterium]|nr:TonB-dependent receptor [Pseudomonadota bacterium]